MRRELERIEIPDEHEARERSWAVVRAAFAEREPQPRRRSWKPIGGGRGGARRRRGPAQPARPRRARRDPRGRRRRAGAAGALLASGAGAAARHRRLGRLGRRAGRLEAAARPLSRGVVVPVRPLRRRVAPERARRADARRERCAGRSPGRTSASRAGAARRRTRGSPTSRTGKLRVVGGDGKGDRLLDVPRGAPAVRRCGSADVPATRARLSLAADGTVRVVERRHWARSTEPRRTDDAASLRVCKTDDVRSRALARERRGSFAEPVASRRTAVARGRLAGRRTSSSSSASAAGPDADPGRLERVGPVPLALVSDDQRLVLRAAVDSSRVLARQRRVAGARGAARGRAGPAPLLPLRLVADLNAGADAPA